MTWMTWDPYWLKKTRRGATVSGQGVWLVRLLTNPCTRSHLAQHAFDSPASFRGCLWREEFRWRQRIESRIDSRIHRESVAFTQADRCSFCSTLCLQYAFLSLSPSSLSDLRQSVRLLHPLLVVGTRHRHHMILSPCPHYPLTISQFCPTSHPIPSLVNLHSFDLSKR